MGVAAFPQNFIYKKTGLWGKGEIWLTNYSMLVPGTEEQNYQIIKSFFKVCILKKENDDYDTMRINCACGARYWDTLGREMYGLHRMVIVRFE